MDKTQLAHWESQFEKEIIRLAGNDPAHDLAHVRRVVNAAKEMALAEGADLSIVVPAAWLHDLVNIPKDDPRRSQASRLSGEEAKRYLKALDYEGDLEAIAHAIEAHSFSAGIAPRTLEAKIVQDADRLDALGAIGVARCFVVGGLLRRPLYDAVDPFAKSRELNDLNYTIDHFYVKLFKIAETLQTKAGRDEGAKRADTMRRFLADLAREIGEPSPF